jgi:hypothetical protein
MDVIPTTEPYKMPQNEKANLYRLTTGLRNIVLEMKEREKAVSHITLDLRRRIAQMQDTEREYKRLTDMEEGRLADMSVELKNFITQVVAGEVFTEKPMVVIH